MEEKRTGRGIGIVIYSAFSVLMLYILISVCFFNSMDYPHKREWLPNLLLICGAVPVLLLAAGLPLKPGMIRKPRVWKSVLVTVLLSLQLLSSYCYFFLTGWDVITVVPASITLAHREALETQPIIYLSTYPNNLFMTSVFSGIIRILNIYFPKLMNTEREYFALIAFQCVLNQGAGILTYCAAKRLFRRERYACTAYGLFLALAGISPWVSIPYSDSMGLIFPIAVLALYLKPTEGKKGILKWAGIGALAWLGYQIKPQTVVVFAAIVITELFSLFRMLRTQRRKVLKAAGALLLGFLCSFGFVRGNIALFASFDLVPEIRFGAAHFLMMGMHPGGGGWSEEDVEYSYSYSTNSERDQADLQLAAERIREMGLGGLVEHLTRKTLTNYNDGTFAWEREGNFYVEMREKPDGVFASFLKNVYYKDGAYRNIWGHLAQAVWLGVLFLSLFSVFSSGRRYPLAVPMLAVIGLTVFVLLFEARARYLYTCVPVFILLAVRGIMVLHGWFQRYVPSFAGKRPDRQKEAEASKELKSGGREKSKK